MGVVRKLLAAEGELSSGPRETAALVAAPMVSMKTVKDSRTLAAATSNWTALVATPALAATLARSARRTTGVKSDTLPATRTAVLRAAAAGGSGGEGVVDVSEPPAGGEGGGRWRLGE